MSIDGMHVFWKNCPMQWQGSFQGQKKKPSIVLEAGCDYNLYLWHATFGYAGTNNDVTIFNLSPLLESLLDGTFAEIEHDAEVVPYEVGGEEFMRMFMLGDGIYPRYARIMKAISEPSGRGQKRYTEWQESKRKDIERAFGVLQSQWQVLARPILLMKPQEIAELVCACLILHNMNVSDRIMGDVHARYDPSHNLEAEAVDSSSIQYPNDFQAVRREAGEGSNGGPADSSIGMSNVDANYVAALQDRTDWDSESWNREAEWNHVRSLTEHLRLQSALIRELQAKSDAQHKNDA